MSRVRLTIGELSLKGFDRAEGRALAEGLKAEFERVLSDPDARAQWVRSRRAPMIRLADARLAPGPAEAREFGRNMVRAIGKELKR